MVGSKSGTVNSRYETDEKTDANDGYIASESRISDYSQSRTTATTNQSGTKSPSLLSGYPHSVSHDSAKVPRKRQSFSRNTGNRKQG